MSNDKSDIFDLILIDFGLADLEDTKDELPMFKGTQWFF